MKGYEILIERNQATLLDDIKISLTSTPVVNENEKLSVLKNETPATLGELVLRQYLIERLIYNLSFNKAILYSIAQNKPFIYPLPNKWQNEIIKHGIKISKILCTLLFIKKIVNFGLHALAEFVIQLSRSLNHSNRIKYNDLGEYVFFDRLTENNLPKYSGKFSNGIISSYFKSFPKPKELNTICHTVYGKSDLVLDGVPVKYIPSPIPPILNKWKLALIFFEIIGWLFFALFDLIRLKWAAIILMREKIKSIFYRNSEIKTRGRNYFFHNSHWIFRPLWTYFAEGDGRSIYFYFYSTNCEHFKRNGTYPNEYMNSWPITTWNNFLVWDKYQADFIDRVIKSEHETKIIGTISFSFSEKTFETVETKIVAVFDVQPLREAVYKILGISFNYYIPPITNKFLDDIIETALSFGYVVVVKRKREIGKYLHWRYSKNIKKYENFKDCIFLDPAIPAEEIIGKSALVISMPFTSTALVAKSEGKKSIYYDPSDKIDKSDRAGHGIMLLSGKKELENWFQVIS